jgi:hypothetical protein
LASSEEQELFAKIFEQLELCVSGITVDFGHIFSNQLRSKHGHAFVIFFKFITGQQFELKIIDEWKSLVQTQPPRGEVKTQNSIAIPNWKRKHKTLCNPHSANKRRKIQNIDTHNTIQTTTDL